MADGWIGVRVPCLCLGQNLPRCVQRADDETIQITVGGPPDTRPVLEIL